ncbi:MAG: hypothetical protein ABJZ55_07885 [Fuerstiella sp.]
MCALMLLCSVVGCGQQSTTLKPKVSFEIYQVVLQPSAQTRSLKNEADGRTFFLLSPSIVTAKDVVSATFEAHAQAGDVLFVKLSRTAGQRMKKATAVRGGQLAVVIEDEIFSVATIHSSVERDLQLTGEFTQEKIDRWFESVN